MKYRLAAFPLVSFGRRGRIISIRNTYAPRRIRIRLGTRNSGRGRFLFSHNMEGDSIYSQIDWPTYAWNQPIGSMTFPAYQCTWDLRGRIAFSLSGREQYCSTYLGVSG